MRIKEKDERMAMFGKECTKGYACQDQGNECTERMNQEEKVGNERVITEDWEYKSG